MIFKNSATIDIVLKAIKGCGGIVSTVAKRLKCDWNTADKYIKKWDETRLAMQDEKISSLNSMFLTI
jgi:transposase